MATPVRVRFAPSPTGMLHVGGVRSALFNYLWARHNGGTFVLRIEDTDQARFVEGAEKQIVDSFAKLGMVPDESPAAGGDYGPYRQSERLDIYRNHADTLVSSGALYPCWCSSERLDELRTAAQKAGSAFKYDRRCLIKANLRTMDEAHVLRFMIPDNPAEVTWDDAVRGRLSFRTNELDDFVAMKSDGYPTYQFANVVDDHLMAISHVLRADEWIPSTPKHLLVYAALGWEPPVLAHLPAIQAPDGRKKLSKRDGAQSVSEYVEEGYLPEALMSFMASLGWNDGSTQEVYTPQELIEKFTLDRIQKSPAKFDKDRLMWMNGLLIRQMDLGELDRRSATFWPTSAGSFGVSYRQAVLGLTQERLKYLGELSELTTFFFETPAQQPQLLTKNVKTDEAMTILEATLAALSSIPWDMHMLEESVRGITGTSGFTTGQFFGVIRVAITGRTAAPGLFETLSLLGKDVSLKRLGEAIKSLS